MQSGSCQASPPRRKRNDLFEVRLRRSARKEINRAGIAGPISIFSERRPRPAWQRPAILQAAEHLFLLFLLFGRHDHTSHSSTRKTGRPPPPYNKHLLNEWKLNKPRPGTCPRMGRANAVARRLLLIPVGNLDNSGPMGELLHQRVGHGPIRQIKVGVPFVQEIDRGVGMVHDLVQRPQLTLA